LSSTNKTFTHSSITTLEILGALNSPTIMWQGTQL
jgi:hypothetical protein